MILKFEKRKQQKIEKQNQDWSETDDEFRRWAHKIYMQYLEECSSRNICIKILDFIFGPVDILSVDLINSYGRHNLEKPVKNQQIDFSSQRYHLIEKANSFNYILFLNE